MVEPWSEGDADGDSDGILDAFFDFFWLAFFGSFDVFGCSFLVSQDTAEGRKHDVLSNKNTAARAIGIGRVMMDGGLDASGEKVFSKLKKEIDNLGKRI